MNETNVSPRNGEAVGWGVGDSTARARNETLPSVPPIELRRVSIQHGTALKWRFDAIDAVRGAVPVTVGSGWGGRISYVEMHSEIRYPGNNEFDQRMADWLMRFLAHSRAHQVIAELDRANGR